MIILPGILVFGGINVLNWVKKMKLAQLRGSHNEVMRPSVKKKP